MTRKEEQRIMEGFQRSYAGFPSGDVGQQEPPVLDFVVTMECGKTIGIELTEVFQSKEQKERSAVKDKVYEYQ